MGFNQQTAKTCDTLLSESKFAELKQLLYSNSNLTEVNCVDWLKRKGREGHLIALYLLVRDSHCRCGKGTMEMAGTDLCVALERIMKFLIRFEQDAACWQSLAQPIDDDLRICLKTKIRDWFVSTVRENRQKEFKDALKNVKIWFKQFPEGEDLEVQMSSLDSAAPGNNRPLPSPVCVRAMIWEKPNTLSYEVVRQEWLSACQNQANQERFKEVRREIVNGLLAEFEQMQHAKGFIDSLSNESSGALATVSNYASAASSYVPWSLFGSVAKLVIG